MSEQDLVRPCVRDLTPYVPGKPIEEVRREFGLTDIIKLASNENPLGPSPRAVQAIVEQSYDVALCALLLNPMIRGFDEARAVLERVWPEAGRS